MAIDEEADATLSVAFVGEVDHGKSTLLGRILLDLGAVPPDRLAVGVADGGLAFLLDGLTEERDGLFTLDTASAAVEVGARRLTLIDVPGHFELLKNMITGASRADVGVIVVDATQGVVAQTLRHLNILRLLGVERCVCALTKMDLVGWRRDVYEALAPSIVRAGASAGVDIGATVAVSAVAACNITARPAAGHPLAWAPGDALIPTLLGMARPPRGTALPRFAVQSVLVRGATTLVMGRVESGSVHKGQVLVDPLSGDGGEILSIERFGEDALDVAGAGRSVGLRLRGPAPRAGTLLAPPDEPVEVGDRLETRLLNVTGQPIVAGMPVVVRLASTTADASVDSTADGRPIGFGDIATAALTLPTAIAADSLASCPPTGRFMLCDRSGQAVAVGVIDRVRSAQPALGRSR